MKYYMSVDGGGTKVIALLFNEHFQLIGWGLGGAINHNFSSMESIEASMRKCIDECLCSTDVSELEVLYISMPGPYDVFIQILQERVKILEIKRMIEGRFSMLAAIQQEKGVLALSGTGSGVFWFDGDKQRHIGGWGTLIGDEGSAYDVGRKGIIAAIHWFEGMGPETIIYDFLIEEWCLSKFDDLIGIVYYSPNQRTKIASVALLVAKAAQNGDKVAKAIFEDAGQEMALQSIALMDKLENGENLAVAISGSTWKGCKCMYQAFCERLILSFPSVKIQMPLFEPVMGGVVSEILKQQKDMDEYLPLIKSNFEKFLYKTQWSYEEDLC